MMVPLVSVVIPFYGDPVDTIELIEQIKRQSCSQDVEIIVSDDFSPIPFPALDNVKVFRRSFNGGFGANVNTGVSNATGKWVFILNSDLSIESNFLEKMLAKAEGAGNALLAPQILHEDGTSQYVGRKFPTVRHFIWEWLTPLARIRHTKFWHRMVGHDLRCATGTTTETDWLMGACMIVQRETYNQLGGMDERYFMNSEEVDFQRRLAQQGIPRIFCGDVSVKHIGGASSGDSLRRRQWVLNSRYIYADKWQVMKGLTPALKTATYINYFFNLFRSLRNGKVDAKAIQQDELNLIAVAQEAALNVQNHHDEEA